MLILIFRHGWITLTFRMVFNNTTASYWVVLSAQKIASHEINNSGDDIFVGINAELKVSEQ
ncbi:hypothetical protein CRN74_01835 [Yersinia frederiksenii]|nr:hypothetical protein CRN74_01835 [Yersinia frederiksenii]